jgi:nucleotide-binding universal stress UspA family protein
VQEIVEHAREGEVSLIILSTHGRTGLRHVLMGSVAENVVRYAPCPVLVVRELEREFLGAAR